MALKEPFPDLGEILASIGEGGKRIAKIDAAEGAAGNISVCIGWPIEVRRRFPVAEEIPLPQPAPHLAGRVVLVTGSGRRLRDIAADPAANLGAVVIGADGETGTLCTSPRPALRAADVGVELAPGGPRRHRRAHRRPTSTPSSTPSRRTSPTSATSRPTATRIGSAGACCAGSPRRSSTCRPGSASCRSCCRGRATLMEANVESLRRHRIVLWSQARRDGPLRHLRHPRRGPHRVRRDGRPLRVHGPRQRRAAPRGSPLDEMRAVVEAFDVRTTII